MDDHELARWFDENKTLLETAYTAAEQPWQQSGVGLHTPRTAADWATLRRPIADSMTHGGTWLDIGCANGYLIECVMQWTAKRGIVLTPYGLDISEKLVDLARQRLPQYADHLFVGNAWDWSPPRRFDHVRTELEYVPEHLRQRYVARLLAEFIVPRGILLVAEYGSSRDPRDHLTIDQDLQKMGFAVAGYRSGILNGKEMTRVALIEQET